MSSSMRLGVPFIAPRQLGAVESILGRQFLPSVDWRTRQSGVDFFPVLAQLTVEDPEPLAHQTLSGAHRTVRCTPDSLVHTEQSGAPFCLLALPHVARGLRGRPLARLTISSPDSPVHTGQSGEF